MRNGAASLSPLLLERPGSWRLIVMLGLFLAVVLPALPLLSVAWPLTGEGSAGLGGAFAGALRNSLAIALPAASGALALGIPAGLLLALYDFFGRRLLTVIFALPLLLPPFLLALGWSMAGGTRLDGYAGPVLVSLLWILPLVVFAVHAAAGGVSATALEAARLAGGERRAVVLMGRHVWSPALAAAGLGAALVIADPGPAQVFRVPVAATEILTSFAALNDFSLAARQSLLAAAVVMAAALPLAWFTAPRLAQALMARQINAARRRPLSGRARVVPWAFAGLILAALVVPLAGLASPLLSGGAGWFSRGALEAARTVGDTVFYGAGAGFIAVLLGFTLALAVGRQLGPRRLVIAGCFFLLCLPPALAGLGMIRLATAAPAWTDPILRGRMIVCIVLGFRFFPVAAMLGLRAWASSAPSWAHAAAVHDVSLGAYLRRVLLPHLLPAAGAAFLLSGLLAIADIGTTLLLHPPGADSLPLAVFTVMANAPEALVAALALVYAGAATALLFVLWSWLESRYER